MGEGLGIGRSARLRDEAVLDEEGERLVEIGAIACIGRIIAVAFEEFLEQNEALGGIAGGGVDFRSGLAEIAEERGLGNSRVVGVVALEAFEFAEGVGPLVLRYQLGHFGPQAIGGRQPLRRPEPEQHRGGDRKRGEHPQADPANAMRSLAPLAAAFGPVPGAGRNVNRRRLRERNVRLDRGRWYGGTDELHARAANQIGRRIRRGRRWSDEARVFGSDGQGRGQFGFRYGHVGDRRNHG